MVNFLLKFPFFQGKKNMFVYVKFKVLFLEVIATIKEIF